MSFNDVIKKSVLEGFSNTDVPTAQVVVILGVTFLVALYIYWIYGMVNRTALYDRSFHVSMSSISVITAGIIIAMQSSIVISLGMVGALSIVRFRTAIKNPMDLLFLFWSIGTGIICGAGLFEIAVVVALTVTVGILLLEFMPAVRKPYLLIINGTAELDETEVLEVVSRLGKRYRVCSRNRKKSGMDMIIEVNTTKESELLSELGGKEYIEQLSLLSHEGEVRV